MPYTTNKLFVDKVTIQKNGYRSSVKTRDRCGGLRGSDHLAVAIVAQKRSGVRRKGTQVIHLADAPSHARQ